MSLQIRSSCKDKPGQNIKVAMEVKEYSFLSLKSKYLIVAWFFTYGIILFNHYV